MRIDVLAEIMGGFGDGRAVITASPGERLKARYLEFLHARADRTIISSYVI